MRGVEHVEHRLGDGEELPLADRRSPFEPVLQRLAFEQLHDEVRGARVRPAGDDVVVHDLDRARVLDAVRRIPLPQEPLAHLAVARKIRVKHLDGGSRAIAVACFVHRSHTADAEQTLERPLLVEHCAHALLRLGVGDLGQTDPIVPW